MEKLYSNPYENPVLVKLYEERYIHHPNQKQDIIHEIRTIENLVDTFNYTSWCDVGCGTAYHLRKTNVDIDKCGVDRSSIMLEQHKDDTTYEIEYVLCDFLDWNNSRKFDLVTNFWFGYAHQPTLNSVLSFFDKLVTRTNKNGSILISLHNQWKIFDRYPHTTEEPMGGKFLFDAMHWSYKEPETGDLYECIVPHIDLIKEKLQNYFSRVEYIDYPIYAGKELMLLQGKKQ